MRIVSWNCHHGECRDRAARLDSLDADVIVLQECGKPAMTDSQCAWFGTNEKKGVGVVARGAWSVTPMALHPGVPDSAYAVEVSGPQPSHLLAIWAQSRPTYVRASLEALDHYGDFLRSAPSIMVGDFNSHPRWDAESRSANHSILQMRLRDEFGLVSAFHAHAGRDGLEEAPTYYHRWQETDPFHIDYCFIPASWTPGIRSVSVGSYTDWATESDHRPLVVDVVPPEP